MNGNHEASYSNSVVYPKVIHKKLEGSLTLSRDAGITFQSNSSSSEGDSNSSVVPWSSIIKHQVSPASYPKHLLKLIVTSSADNNNTSSSGGKSSSSSIYQLSSREELERIRSDVSNFLQAFKSQQTATGSSSTGGVSSPPPLVASSSLSGKKRAHSEVSPVKKMRKVTTTSFGQFDADSLAVTRSSLLAANPTLRAQHQYLVKESQTLNEDDFWKTHQDLLEEEYARISGITRAGTSSLLQSHLQLLTGRVTLGVEEMRQIFILYPAVHKAYEEKVPLELSDEQFWRKYLESEYFHRDRGRLGAASRNATNTNSAQQDSKGGKKKGPSVEDQEARAAAIGTDDLFSRYDQKIREETRKDEDKRQRQWGSKLAVGQFDLASTFETERGQLLEGPKDNHPQLGDDGKGSKVIQKYNRHWAMVLHPEHAVAGSNLMDVARTSAGDVLPDDNDAKVGGGNDGEMSRLVGFASSAPEDANHASGTGNSDGYEELVLKNIEAYYSGHATTKSNNGNGASIAANGHVNNDNPDDTVGDEAKEAKRIGVFATSLAAKMKAQATKLRQRHQEDKGSKSSTTTTNGVDDAFPPPDTGKKCLGALTKKMAEDSKTDADALEIVNNLPEEFKKKLHSYFRRSSELLRHFFGVRKLVEESKNSGSGVDPHSNDKLKKIVTGMETVYREMNDMRNEVTATGEAGETMRKMCLQIMDQLDWAFKLHREGSGTGGGGGFVTIESF